MIMNIIISVIIFFTYIHVLVHLYVNNINKVDNFSTLSSSEITLNCHKKIPFVFDIGDININVSDLSHNHINTYEPITLLEPNVHFTPSHNVYYNCSKIETNLSCRNFYLPSDISCNVVLIHPKYKLNFEENFDKFTFKINDENKILDNKNYKNIILNPGQALFVPNYWLVYLKTDGYLNKIQYTTFLNNICFIKPKELFMNIYNSIISIK